MCGPCGYSDDSVHQFKPANAPSKEPASKTSQSGAAPAPSPLDDIPAMPSTTMPRKMNIVTPDQMGKVSEIAEIKFDKSLGGMKFKLLTNEAKEYFLQSSFRETYWKGTTPPPITIEKLTRGEAENFQKYLKNPPEKEVWEKSPPTALNIIQMLSKLYGEQNQAEQIKAKVASDAVNIGTIRKKG